MSILDSVSDGWIGDEVDSATEQCAQSNVMIGGRGRSCSDSINAESERLPSNAAWRTYENRRIFVAKHLCRMLAFERSV